MARGRLCLAAVHPENLPHLFFPHNMSGFFDVRVCLCLGLSVSGLSFPHRVLSILRFAFGPTLMACGSFGVTRLAAVRHV